MALSRISVDGKYINPKAVAAIMPIGERMCRIHVIGIREYITVEMSSDKLADDLGLTYASVHPVTQDPYGKNVFAPF